MRSSPSKPSSAARTLSTTLPFGEGLVLLVILFLLLAIG